MKKVLFVALVVLFATTANAQTILNLVFQIDYDSNVWFGDDQWTQGMALAPGGELILSDIGGGNVIRRLNADTGEEIFPSLSGYRAEGLAMINKIGVSDGGVIYVCNLADAGDRFNLYRHASTTSALSIAYEEDSISARLGDDMAVQGAGNNTRILVTGQGGETALFTTSDGGLTFSRTTISPSPGLGDEFPNVAWDPGSADYWLRSSTSALRSTTLYNGSTHVATATVAGTTEGYGPFALAQWGSQKVMGLGVAARPLDSTGVKGLVIDVATDTLLYETEGLEPAGGVAYEDEDIGGFGEVVIDPVKKRFYFLYTGNTITCWAVPPTGVKDWAVYE